MNRSRATRTSPAGSGNADSLIELWVLPKDPVIERAAKMPYPRFVAEHLCAPLAMKSMQPDHIWNDIAHRAAGYGTSQKGGDFRCNPDDISWKLPAGGWISTIGDLARFGAGLVGPDLLSVES